MAVDYDDSWATCARTFATLRISADDLDPMAVTEGLGVAPTESWAKGEEFGREEFSKRQRRFGGWRLSTRNKLDSRDLRRHVDWLLDAVDGNEAVLAALMEKGAKVDVFCCWESAHGHGGPELSPQQTRRLATLGLTIGLDIYFPDATEDSMVGSH